MTDQLVHRQINRSAVSATIALAFTAFTHFGCAPSTLHIRLVDAVTGETVQPTSLARTRVSRDSPFQLWPTVLTTHAPVEHATEFITVTDVKDGDAFRFSEPDYHSSLTRVEWGKLKLLVGVNRATPANLRELLNRWFSDLGSYEHYDRRPLTRDGDVYIVPLTPRTQ